MSLLRLEVKAKRFGARSILAGVSLDLQRGEAIAVLGASGSGKSTLLRIAAGLDERFDGHLACEGSAGVVFQEPRLLPWLDVAGNIALADAPGARDSARIAELLCAVELPTDTARLLPRQLSGGMAQRVAIARALYDSHDLLLLDEPFSALDVPTRRQLIETVVALRRRQNIAMLLVTHDPAEAIRMTDKILVLGRDGRLAAQHVVDERTRSDAVLRESLTESVLVSLAGQPAENDTSN